MTSKPLLSLNFLTDSICSLLPQFSCLTCSFDNKDSSRFEVTFSLRSSSAFSSPSVGTTRRAVLEAIIEQIPPQPDPSSRTFLPETMVWFEARTEAMSRADSHSIKPVDLQVCWNSFESSLILKFQSCNFNSIICYVGT
ncbi:hypothetical protein Hanom_Chr10g00950311 [Helianthus anomalus]